MWGNVTNMNGAPRVADYCAALRAWTESKPWRVTSRTPRQCVKYDAERPICPNLRQHKHKSIVKIGEAIAFRLHRTDVITYYPDGCIQIYPYRSAMTDEFARPFLPYGLRTHFNQDTICVTRKDDSSWANGRLYIARNALHLRPSGGDYAWEVENPEPWTQKHVDRAKARELYESYGYNLFRDAGPTFFGIQGDMGRGLYLPRCDPDWMEALKVGPSAWDAFIYMGAPHRRWRNPSRKVFDPDPPFTFNTILAKIRREICNREKAYTVEKLPYVVGYGRWRQVRHGW